MNSYRMFHAGHELYSLLMFLMFPPSYNPVSFLPTINFKGAPKLSAYFEYLQEIVRRQTITFIVCSVWQRFHGWIGKLIKTIPTCTSSGYPSQDIFPFAIQQHQFKLRTQNLTVWRKFNINRDVIVVRLDSRTSLFDSKQKQTCVVVPRTELIKRFLFVGMNRLSRRPCPRKLNTANRFQLMTGWTSLSY